MKRKRGGSLTLQQRLDRLLETRPSWAWLKGPPLAEARALADEIAPLVVAHKKHPSLKWHPDGSVTILWGRGNVACSGKRFDQLQGVLTRRLLKHSWRRSRKWADLSYDPPEASVAALLKGELLRP